MKNRKPLKIAVVVGVFPTVSEAFITNQLRFLISQGHDVDIFATRYLDNPLFSTRDYSDLKTKSRVLSKVALLPKGYLNRLFSSISVLLRFNKIVQLLKAFNIFKHGMSALDFSVFFKTYYKYYFSIHGYDVVHIHFGDNAVHLKNQISNFNKSVVVTFHGYDAHKFDNSFYSTLSQKRDITLTVNTNFTKSKVERLGFDASQIQILPVGLDTNFFKPSKNLTSDKFLKVLFLGRLIHFKAPILAIQIAEKLSKKYKNIRLDIIGQGTDMMLCLDYVQSNDLHGIVKFHGSKSQIEIKDFMSNSHIFIFPGIIDENGRCENQGLVIQEAQAMQLPVVTSNVGGIPDGLINGKTGFVVDEGNIDGFVSKILWLIDNPSSRKKMGKAGRQFVVENYDSSILGEKLLDIYYNSLKN